MREQGALEAEGYWEASQDMYRRNNMSCKIYATFPFSRE
jgi:hypothetical protein